MARLIFRSAIRGLLPYVFQSLRSHWLYFGSEYHVADANPPKAPEKPHEITEAGHTRNDPFFWLREKDNPEVLKYLEAENRYTEMRPATYR